jgi:hypothetical protein
MQMTSERRSFFGSVVENLWYSQMIIWQKKHHVQAETLLNKSVMYTFTAAAVVFSAMSQSLAAHLGKDINKVRNILPEQVLPSEGFQSFQSRTHAVPMVADHLPGIRGGL